MQHGAVKLSKLFPGQGHGCRRGVLFEIGAPFRSGNRNEVDALVQNPRQGNLAGSQLSGAGDIADDLRRL